MLVAIIPCRRGDHLQEVVSKLGDATVVVVRDRCKVECDGVDDYVDVSQGDGFMAGYARDAGIDYVLEKYGFADGVLFIDEDCIPQDDLVKDHESAIFRSIPVVSIGRRLERGLGWKDPREIGEAGQWNMFSSRGTVIQNAAWVTKCLATWSCNLGLNMPAVRVLRRAMLSVRKANRLFNPAFDGHWGGEDAYLGYLAWSYRVPMAYLPRGANAVKHMDHPRPLPEYGKGFTEILDSEVSYLRRYLMAHPLSIDDITP